MRANTGTTGANGAAANRIIAMVSLTAQAEGPGGRTVSAGTTMKLASRIGDETALPQALRHFAERQPQPDRPQQPGEGADGEQADDGFRGHGPDLWSAATVAVFGGAIVVAHRADRCE